jgi:hypothetical protein
VQFLSVQYASLYLNVHFENGRNHWLISVYPIKFCSSDSCHYQNKLFIYDCSKLRNSKSHMIFIIMCFFYQNLKIDTSRKWKVQGLCFLPPHVVLNQFLKMQGASANHSSLTRGNRIHPISALTSEMGYVHLHIVTETINIIVQYLQVLDTCAYTCVCVCVCVCVHFLMKVWGIQ